MAEALLLPPAGRRNYDDTYFNNVGSVGNYWSSTPNNANNAYNLNFNTSNVNPQNNNNRSNGYSVRAVLEAFTNPAWPPFPRNFTP